MTPSQGRWPNRRFAVTKSVGVASLVKSLALSAASLTTSVRQHLTSRWNAN